VRFFKYFWLKDIDAGSNGNTNIFDLRIFDLVSKV